MMDLVESDVKDQGDGREKREKREKREVDGGGSQEKGRSNNTHRAK
jgi:hypothetical protein